MDTEVSPERAAEMAKAGEAELIDVRRDDEWEKGRIEVAKHIPLDQLAGRAAEVEGPVIFYCAVGERSLMAAEAFAGAGREAGSMAGGIAAWEAAGLPTIS